ncbi:MAG: threonine/serine exporter family protein [Acholeplasmatales bacterium]|nr:threonine/serine exporter family protein [Acholeplasmatales bacterium]
MEEVKNLPPVNKWKKILDFALFIGKRLLQNGAEIHRVEETVEFICKAYGCKYIDVYAIPNMIEATVEAEDDYYTTKVKRIRSIGTNLYNVEKLNRISRRVCVEKPPVEELDEIIKDFIANQEPEHKWLMYVGAFLAIFGFTLFFGGTWRDALAASLTSLVMAVFLFTNHKVINKTLDTLIVSLIGGFVSALLCKIHIGEHISSVMIGSIMIVIPGMALSTSFKDIMMDDLLSGSLRLMQTIMTALIIAIGYSAAAVVFRNDIEVIVPDIPAWAFILEGVLGSFGFALIFNNNYKHLITIPIGAAIVTATYWLLDYLDQNIVLCTMVPAAVGIFYAEFAARFHKAPSICFLTPITLVLAPGYSLYYTMYSFWKISESGNQFTDYLLRTFNQSFGIGAGIIVGMVIVKVSLYIIYKVIRFEKTKPGF